METFCEYFYPNGRSFVKEVKERVINHPGAAIACQFYDREEKDVKLGYPINVSPIIYIDRERSRLSLRIERFLANFF